MRRPELSPWRSHSPQPHFTVTVTVTASLYAAAYFVLMCCVLPSAVGALEVVCRPHVDVFYNDAEGNVTAGAEGVDYAVQEDTRACDASHASFVAASVGGNPPCDEADLDVSISSIAVLPNGTNHFPYVALNVSVVVHVSSPNLFMRLQCIEAPDHEDPLCHDHEEQILKWGRMIWPCRSLSLNESHLRLPYRFSYPCFHMIGFSHYLVNISLAPNLCTALFLVTIPQETQLHSSIAHFYNHQPTDADWSPLVIVDLTPSDGVWIRYARPDDRSVKQMAFAIYEKREDSTSRFLHSETVDAPSSGFKWTNVPAGNYTVVAYVDRHDCRLVCEPAEEPALCRRCAHTLAKFAVPSDKYTLTWRNIRAVTSFAKVALVILFVVLGSAALVICVLYVYARWSNRRRRPIERELVLSARPTVLLLYTDDCPQHTACVTALAQLLSQYANAHVFLDQEQLNSPGMIPTRWLVDTFAKVQFVLFVFSEGTEAVLRGERLVCRRPFPDLFDTAINHAICELDRFISARGSVVPRPFHNKFMFAHFSFSPLSVIPSHIAAFPVRVFSLPVQIGPLFAMLHEQPLETEVVHQADTTLLERAIQNTVDFRRENPLWLTMRLAPPDEKTEVDGESISTEAIELREPLVLPTAEERLRLAAEHHIEPPDEEPQLESGLGDDETQFALIGSPDDPSESSGTEDGCPRGAGRSQYSQDC